MSKTILSSFIVLIVMFFSCHRDKKLDATYTTKDKTAVISLAFDTLIGNESKWLNFFDPVKTPKSTDIATKSNENEEVEQKHDNVSLFVYIIPKMQTLTYHNDEIKSFTTKKNFKAYFPHIDDSYRDLLIELTKTKVEDKVTIENIKTKYGYKIDYSSNETKNKNRKHLTVGKIAFSTLIFNKKADKACLYAEFNCGGLCGYGNIYLFNKTKGKWSISAKRNLWIS